MFFLTDAMCVWHVARPQTYHLALAQSNAPATAQIHCPHASASGGGVCVNLFCTNYKSTCADTRNGVAYTNCATQHAAMPLGVGGSPQPGDTQSCREYHLALAMESAANAVIHCPHASLSGGGVCVAPSTLPPPPSPPPLTFCEGFAATCTGVYGAPSYGSPAECEATTSAMVQGAVGAAAFGRAGGNTLACRTFHLMLATTMASGPASHEIHCPHASSTGGNTCVDSSPPPPPPPSQFCATYQSTCVTGSHSPAYTDCATSIAQMAAGTPGSTAATNTIACREYHLGLALTNPSIHCPHASEGGGRVCVDPSPPPPSTFCATYQAACVHTGNGTSYESDVSTSCDEFVNINMTAGTLGSTASDDTLACREYHLGVALTSAANAVIHCPHASATGGGVCVSPPPPPPDFCTAYGTACVQPGYAAPYADCATKVSVMAAGDAGSTAAGDTLACRQYHLGLALTSNANARVHCPHASEAGGGVCVGPYFPYPSGFCANYNATCRVPGNPLGEPYDHCVTVMAIKTFGPQVGDTFQCRNYHLGIAMQSATDAAIHCPHASPNGGGVCVNPSPPPPSTFCSDYQTTCVDPARSVAYVDCPTVINGFTPGSAGSSAAGNTLSCRTYHLGLAKMSGQNAVIHCPHASLSGGDVCVNPSPPSLAPSSYSSTVDLGNGITLSFAPSPVDVAITVTYAGTSWLGFGVTPSGMVGSKIVIGSMVDGQLAAKKYSATAYAKPSADATQDFVGMSFSQANGVSTLSFNAPLTWLEQFSNGSPQVSVLAAHGTGNVLAYHGTTKKVSVINSFREPPSPPPPLTFCSEYAATCASNGHSDPYVDCVAATVSLMHGTIGATTAGNTLSCRVYHLSLAKSSPLNAAIHCPHASLTGGGVCVDPSPPPPASFCSDYDSVCSVPSKGVPYADCGSSVAMMAPGTPGSGASADTLACRQYHLGLAATGDNAATIHCPHASLDGGGVCVNASPPPPSFFCAEYASTCNTGSSSADFLSAAYSDCASDTTAMPQGVSGSNAAGNTLSCREYHLRLAMQSASNAAIHCPHASASGGGVCVEASPPPSAIPPMALSIDLGNGITLSFVPGATDVAITVTYAGTSWLGFGVTPSGMVGSKIVIGSMVDGQLAALKYDATGYVAPSADATQDFTAMSFSQANGMSTLSFNAPLTWLEQFSNGSPQVSVLAAHGTGNVLAYHGTTKKVSVINSFRAPAPTTFCTKYIATCVATNYSTAYPDCASAIQLMDAGVDGSNAAGDTLSCRQYHLGLAESSDNAAPVHCPHASASGGGVCVYASPPPPLDFCAAYATTCDAPDYAPAYTDCNNETSTMPAGVAGSSDAAGNTLACRTYHLGIAMQSAANAQVHCPHASVSGGGVCVDASPPPIAGLSYPASTLASYEYMHAVTEAENSYTVHWKLRGAAIDMAVTSFVPTPNPSGWVAIAFAPPDGMMIGSSAVMGQPGSPSSVKMYQLDAKPPSFGAGMEELLNDTSIEIVDGQVTMKFTRSLAGRISIVPSSSTLLLWGFGSGPYGPGSAGYHGTAKGRFSISFGGDASVEMLGAGFTVDTINVYMMLHGLLMFLGWGVLLPLGAITSRYFRHRGPIWFVFHRALQVCRAPSPLLSRLRTPSLAPSHATSLRVSLFDVAFRSPGSPQVWSA